MQYFDGKPSGLNAVNIVRAAPRFVALRARINEAIIHDYALAKEAVKVGVDASVGLSS